MPRLTAIALGGVIGSVARFAVAQPFSPWTAFDWPWATLIVNVVGCLLIGIIASSRAIERGPLWLRPFLITGVLGGFTTFSAFALETGLLLEGGRVGAAAAYLGVTLAVGLLAVRLGVRIERALPWR